MSIFIKLYRQLSWPWCFEALELALSATSIAILAVLLAYYDDEPIFSWNGINLQVIAAILAVIFRASLVAAVASCLGQWKWILFTRSPRVVLDFERLDRATRGPRGALDMVLYTKKAWMAKLGAIVLLIAIGVDPVSQQLLQLKSAINYQRSEQAATAKTQTYLQGDIKLLGSTLEAALNHSLGLATVVDAMIDIPMEVAIMNGLTSSLDMIRRQLQINCPTGNCKWSNFETLGVCHQCSNVTSQLEWVDDWITTFAGRGNLPISAYKLPNGAFLSNVNGMTPSPYGNMMMAFGTGDPNKTIAMNHLHTLIWSMSMIHLKTDIAARTDWSRTYWPNIDVVASECALFYCVQRVSSEVVDGVIREEIEELTDITRDWNSWQIIDPTSYIKENLPPVEKMHTLEFDKYYSLPQRRDLILGVSNHESRPRYNLSWRAINSISEYFQSRFTTEFTFPFGYNDSHNRAADINAVCHRDSGVPRPVCKMWHEAINGLDGWNRQFATLATSMTNEIRNSNIYSTRSDDISGQGFMGMPGTRYQIEWAWIAPYLVLLAISIIFFVVTNFSMSKKKTASTKKILPWKNSSLAVMAHSSAFAHLFNSKDENILLENKAKTEKIIISIK